MSSSALLFGYVAVSLAALAVLTVYSELRRRRFEPEPTEDHIFRCAQCGLVYTDDPDVDRSRCPNCGKTNEAVAF